VIRADSIHSLDNLLLLCGTCHRAFDRRIPAWTFLPSDMDALIAEEEAFHFACTTNASRAPTSRPSYPTIPQLRYTRYLVRDEDPAHIAPIAVVQKSWMGDPALTVTRNASILGAPKPTPDLAAVFPKLVRLLDLYRLAPSAGSKSEMAKLKIETGAGKDGNGGPADDNDGAEPDAVADVDRGPDDDAAARKGAIASNQPPQPSPARKSRRRPASLVGHTSQRGRHHLHRPKAALSPVNNRTSGKHIFRTAAETLSTDHPLPLASHEPQGKRPRRMERSVDRPTSTGSGGRTSCAAPAWTFGPSWTAGKISHYLRDSD
jgi:hypothetical protein